jgi:uncharacterized Ntn-hydrolase superfamily protein
MTFSILGFDPNNGDLGVAVASKFPNIGVVTPFAKAGVGAVATQSYINTGFGPRGLELLESGATPEEAMQALVASDPGRDARQMGIIDSRGRGATFTGAECFEWNGGVVGDGFVAQGNVVTSAAVVEEMARVFQQTSGGPLTVRLIEALAAGQAAGGDRRGQQSAALLVVRDKGGYGGHDDRYCSISIYDHAQPVEELRRCYALHRLTYFRSRDEDLLPINNALAKELQGILRARDFYHGEIHGMFDAATAKALHDFMGWENYDERMRDDDQIDREVLEDLRIKHAAWSQQ